MRDSVVRSGANIVPMDDDSEHDDREFPVQQLYQEIGLLPQQQELPQEYDTVYCLDRAMEQTRALANEVVSLEACRVNKKLMLAYQQGISDQEHRMLDHQAKRSSRMIDLLRRLEQIQEMLLDEVMACADDADQRRDCVALSESNSSSCLQASDQL